MLALLLAEASVSSSRPDTIMLFALLVIAALCVANVVRLYRIYHPKRPGQRAGGRAAADGSTAGAGGGFDAGGGGGGDCG